MDSTLKSAMDRRGLKLKDLIGKDGICYAHACRHYSGERAVSAEYAVKYEAQLGIPRYELRPDLWSPAMFRFLAPSQDAAGSPAQAPAPAVF